MRFGAEHHVYVAVVLACLAISAASQAEPEPRGTACEAEVTALQGKITALQAEVDALQAKLSAQQADTTPADPTKPLRLSLLTFVGDAFRTAGYEVSMASAEALEAARSVDGFFIAKQLPGRPAERLLVVGKAEATLSGGPSAYREGNMHSYRVGVDVSAIDPATRLVVASVNSETHILGMTIDAAMTQKTGIRKLEPLRTALLMKLQAARP